MMILDTQPNLTRFLDSVTIDNCPHMLLIKGRAGYGQQDFIKALSDKFRMPLVDITENINSESIFQIISNPNPSIYTVNLDLISIRNQSALLRTVENPGVGCFFVLCGEPRNILNAIANRCQQLEISPCSEEDLKLLFPNANPELFNLHLSPEQISLYANEDLLPYQQLLDNMFSNFNRANISNILTIENKFKWDTKSPGSLDFDLFCRFFLKKCAESVTTNSDASALWYAVRDMGETLAIPHVDKRRVFEKFLIESKERAYTWY